MGTPSSLGQDNSSWFLWPMVILVGIVAATLMQPKPPVYKPGSIEYHVDQAYRK